MVRDVSIEGDHVKVTIELTVAHCPLAKTLQTDVEKALKKSNEVRSVTVETTAMSKTELNELRTQSEEHTSELQSRLHLVCRLLLEKKKNKPSHTTSRVHPY